MDIDEYYSSIKENVGDVYHHGILGQKWGVRRYQNEDGSLTPEGIKRYSKSLNKESKKAGLRKETDLKAKTLPKGMTVYRTSVKGEELDPNATLYITTNKTDRDRIEGITPWMSAQQNKNVRDFTTKTFTLNKNINLPSEEEVRSIQHDILKDKSIVSSIALEMGVDQMLSRYGKTALDAYKMTVNEFSEKYGADIKTADIYKTNASAIVKSNSSRNLVNLVDAYKNKRLKDLDSIDIKTIDAKSIMDFGLGGSKIYKEKLISELRSRGYDGMYDNAMIRAGSSDIRSSKGFKENEAYEPVILFNASSVTKSNKKELQINQSNVDYGMSLIYNLKYNVNKQIKKEGR